MKKNLEEKNLLIDDNITYDNWELLDTQKTNYRSVPVRETVSYVPIERDNKKEEENEEKEGTEKKKLKGYVCDKVINGGEIGIIDRMLLRVTRGLFSPFNPLYANGLIACGFSGGESLK